MVTIFDIKETGPGINRLRSITAQVIACMAPNFLLLDIGMAVSFITIALPDLLNASQGLSLNETQASWFGSIPFLIQPIGALLSGPIVNYYGRKKANFMVNIPHIIAWTLFYFAWNLPSLFTASAFLGLGTGIMEAPVNSYVGEVSESTVRGAICTGTQVFSSAGLLLMYFMGTVLNWRQAALCCIAAPIASMLFILFAPETPVWLLIQGREKDALKSLCYLRGWTTPDNVREEYDELIVYAKSLKCCAICSKENNLQLVDCEHFKMNAIKRFVLKTRYVMLSQETLRPLTLVMVYFVSFGMSGIIPIRPNMVNVCSAFGMADDAKNIVFMMGVITFVISILVLAFISTVGKRKVILTAMLGTSLSATALSVYATLNLPDTVFSYDTSTFPKETSKVPLILFYALAVFTALNISWVLIGEVFHFRSRAYAQGTAAALNYVVSFLGSKTLINMEKHIKLSGSFAVYASFGFMGTIYLYFFMPETEGKSLQEIESYYNGELRIFADDAFIDFVGKFKRKR